MFLHIKHESSCSTSSPILGFQSLYLGHCGSSQWSSVCGSACVYLATGDTRHLFTCLLATGHPLFCWDVGLLMYLQDSCMYSGYELGFTPCAVALGGLWFPEVVLFYYYILLCDASELTFVTSVRWGLRTIYLLGQHLLKRPPFLWTAVVVVAKQATIAVFVQSCCGLSGLFN